MPDVLNPILADPTFGAAVTALGVLAVGLWVAAAWWVYADLGRRTGSELAQLFGAGWILVSTPAMLPLSLPIYLLARPQSTRAERRSLRFIEALGTDRAADGCPVCGLELDGEWRRCPACATWLQSACASCGSWSPADLAICPWCATERGDPAATGVTIGLPGFVSSRAEVALDTKPPRSGEPGPRRESARRHMPARLG